MQIEFKKVLCLTALLVILALDSCSTLPSREVPNELSESSQPVSLQPVSAGQRSLQTSGFDQETLYKLLVAEIAGQRGQLDLAAKNYLELARDIPDPRLASRATRIAVYAKNEEQALEAAQLWVQESPNDLEARQGLAAMLIRKGQVDEAIGHLEFVLSNDKSNTGEVLQLVANFLGQEKDKHKALDVMKRLLESRQDNPDALFAYALLAVRAEDLTEAKNAMEKVMALTPNNSNSAMAYLSILQKAGETEKALDWLKARLTAKPDDFEMRLLYARMLADNKSYAQALQEFETLKKAKPDNEDVSFALGLLYLQENDKKNAQLNLERLANNDKYGNDASFHLGQIAEAEKDYDLAIKWYQAVSKSDVYKGDLHFDAQLSIALVLAKQNDLDAALAHLDGLNAKTPDAVKRVIRVKGEILSEHKRYNEALSLYDAELNKEFDADLLYTRAMLGEKMGRIEILERDLKLILEKDPSNIQALNALGYTLADRTNRHQEAYDYIKRALDINSNDFYILDSMGWVLYRMGRLQEAVDFLRRAQALRNDPEVAAHLGEVLWAMGEQQAARKVWENALLASPGDKKILETMNRLSRETTNN